MLKVYNSLTRKKELFIPMRPGKIGMYVCGITVYDRCHLGHARAMVCFDVIVRFLRTQGFDVTFVRNITDIDDKIINRAIERNMPIQKLTAKYIEAMDLDTRALKILPPDKQPRATENIDAIIALIQRLINKGCAYITATGDVCFHVPNFEGYGKLSHKDLEGLEAGARIEVTKDKRSPLDFVLWKMAKPGEPSWPSPWGLGRPGWHIECSAMAMEELGEQFDIHGGGVDLQFPHHENEIAQSEGATGHAFAHYWLHVGLLQINNEKMAKSTGNFLTIEAVLKKYHPETVRYFLLSSHYRSPLNYSDENLENAYKGLVRLYQSLKGLSFDKDDVDKSWIAKFNKVMNDDFNTPEALAVLFQLSHEVNKTKSSKLAATLYKLAGVLGILTEAPDDFLQAGLTEKDKEWIETLIKERNEARKERNWAKADEIRNQLLDKGVEIEDGSEGTTWRISREEVEE
ncbi:cysteine--tRNA ligase [Legionella impletisoli]|uniref:Cysteine--tRNA ligase n=1 Tax=Legionella impletisoli TaxID=343510 RepID=A0A917JQU1_9GAMM|nr:cysteine--tRNA ligase [Legionella impletisoli]GGI80748.1 cysteine--tRNA ligase [Legionella impletisoli]